MTIHSLSDLDIDTQSTALISYKGRLRYNGKYRHVVWLSLSFWIKLFCFGFYEPKSDVFYIPCYSEDLSELERYITGVMQKGSYADIYKLKAADGRTLFTCMFVFYEGYKPLRSDVKMMLMTLEQKLDNG